MFLIDAGAETEMGYAGDMPSTIPAGKKFSYVGLFLIVFGIVFNEYLTKHLRKKAID
jgi:hypothetical protein